MKPYKQTIYETCLAVCMLQLLNIKPTSEMEVEIWKNGWKFNFLEGQLNFVTKKWDQKVDLIIENKDYAQHLQRLVNQNIRVFHRKFTNSFLDKIIQRSPAVIYVDNYYLTNLIHYPHFIFIFQQTRKYFKVADSWNGTIKNLSKNKIYKAVQGLRKQFKFSPVVICLKE